MEAPRPPLVRDLWTAINASYTCNNRCIFCAQGTLRSQVAAPPEPGMQGDGPLVVFLGGEPTLLDDLPARVELSRAQGARRIVLQTNARRLAYPAYAQSLANAGVDALDVSLQGGRAEIHDHHTRCPGSFVQTLAGVRAARNLGMEVGLTTVITRSNFRHLDELTRRAASLGIKRLHMTPARPVGEGRRLLARVVPRLSWLIPHLGAAAREADHRGMDLRTSALPLCVTLPAGCGLSRPGTFLDPGAREARFAPPCDGCSRARDCAGVDPAYLAHHGDKELSPPSAQTPTPVAPDEDLFAGPGWTAAPASPDEEAPGG